MTAAPDVFRDGVAKGVGHLHVCLCCGADRQPAGPGNRPPLPFCGLCGSERCPKCRRWVRVEKAERDPTFNLVGRPRGPQMPCGWGCGARLTDHKMRAHFTGCPNRPAISDLVARPSRFVPIDVGLPAQSGPASRKPGTSKIKRGRPPGRRMPCGWRCGARLTASELRRHFTKCPRRPRA